MSNPRRKEKKSQKLREKYYEKRIPLNQTMTRTGKRMGNVISEPLEDAIDYSRAGLRRRRR